MPLGLLLEICTISCSSPYSVETECLLCLKDCCGCAEVADCSSWSIKLIRQGNARALPRVPVGVDRDLDAGMPELFRHVLDWGMVFVKLDCSITVAQVMYPNDAEPSTCTHTLMGFVDHRGMYRLFTGATEDHLRNGRCPTEKGFIRALITQIE